jgi:hypothetical protein
MELGSVQMTPEALRDGPPWLTQTSTWLSPELLARAPTALGWGDNRSGVLADPRCLEPLIAGHSLGQARSGSPPDRRLGQERPSPGQAVAAVSASLACSQTGASTGHCSAISHYALNIETPGRLSGVPPMTLPTPPLSSLCREIWCRPLDCAATTNLGANPAVPDHLYNSG